MITKGIIKSIDYNGNTCTVRVPFFETANNDEIVSTAPISNTPGSYNGYKVDDVVWVAFEDGSMSNPVVIGKLYLGVEAEKADPRGTINVVDSKVSNSAEIPFDTKLRSNVADNVANTNVPYSSLEQVANSLSTARVDIDQNDRDYGNRFKQVFSNTEGLKSTLEQTAADIRAEVVHKKQDGSQEGLGWDLNPKDWTITAEDTVDGVDKSLEIFKVEREGVSISGDLKLNGYPKETIIRYAYGERNSYPALYTDISTKTINAKVDGVGGWTTSELSWSDTKYIWQWTQIIGYQYNKATTSWDTTYQDNVICVGGGSATSYWLKLSTPIHTGHNQNAPITVIAYKKHGDKVEEIDDTAYLRYKWDLDATEYSQWSTKELKIETDYQEADLIIQATHNKDVDPIVVYEEETITYSPLNTPIIDLSNDSASLPYSGDTRLGEEVVSSTASIYLNGKDISSNFDFIWSNNTTSSTISVSEAGEYTVVATVKENNDIGVTIPDGGLKKVFSVSKVLKGDQGIQGLTGRKVLSTVKYYMLSNNIPSAPNSSTTVYDSGNSVNEWYKSPMSWPADYDANTWSYYETVRTTYEESDGTETIEWSDPVKNSMLTVDFINALGITAKRITVGDKFEANALDEKSPVKIGGFNVENNRLTNLFPAEPAGDNKGKCKGVGMSAADSSFCWAFWAGHQSGDGTGNGEKAYGHDAPFRVGHQGELYAGNATIEGNITASTLEITEGATVTGLKANHINVKGLNANGITVKQKLSTDTEATGNTGPTVFEANANLGNVTIGGFNVTDKTFSKGTLGELGSVIVSTGTSEAADIGGSGSVTNWNFTAGNTFGVRTETTTNESELYVSKGKIGGFSVSENTLSAEGKIKITNPETNDEEEVESKVSISTDAISVGPIDQTNNVPLVISGTGEIIASNGTFSGRIIASGAELKDTSYLSMASDGEAVFNTLNAATISVSDNISTKGRVNSNDGYFFGPYATCGLSLDGTEYIEQECTVSIGRSHTLVDGGTNDRYKITVSCFPAATAPIKITYSKAQWGELKNAISIPEGNLTINVGSTSASTQRTVTNTSKYQLMYTTDGDTIVGTPAGGIINNPTQIKIEPKITQIEVDGKILYSASNNNEPGRLSVNFTQYTPSNDSNLKLDCSSFQMNGNIIIPNTATFTVKGTGNVDVVTLDKNGLQTDGKVQFKVLGNYYEPVIRLPKQAKVGGVNTDIKSPNCFWSWTGEVAADSWQEIPLPDVLRNDNNATPKNKVVAVTVSATYGYTGGSLRPDSKGKDYEKTAAIANCWYVDFTSYYDKIYVCNGQNTEGRVCVMVAAVLG